MAFEAIEERDFPKVFRTSMYDNILKRFRESQFERAKEKIDVKTNYKTIQSALRRRAKKLNMSVDIVINPDKTIFIKKV